MFRPQVRNPMKYTSLTSRDPDYVTCDNFRNFVAYGLMTCWLSDDEFDPGADQYMPRKVTHQDIDSLRTYFLEMLEYGVGAFWSEMFITGIVLGSPARGYGICAKEFQQHADVHLIWTVEYKNGSIRFTLQRTNYHTHNEETSLWLDPEALQDRGKVFDVLTEARQHVQDTEIRHDVLNMIRVWNNPE